MATGISRGAGGGTGFGGITAPGGCIGGGTGFGGATGVEDTGRFGGGTVIGRGVVGGGVPCCALRWFAKSWSIALIRPAFGDCGWSAMENS